MSVRLGLAMALLLCGCGNVQQSGSNSASVVGQSIGGGTDNKSITCNVAATLTVKWSGTAGTLSVDVSQGQTSVFSNTYPVGASEQTATQSLGTGSFNFTVSRSSDWKGSYDVKVACP